VKKVHIRWMIRRDMAEVMEIEHLCFSLPWTEEELIKFLRGRNNIGMVAEYGDRVVGFMLYSLYKNRIYLEALGVHPDCQRERIGRQMFEKLFAKLSNKGRTFMSAMVREGNLSAQLFFKSVGFRCYQTIKEAYDGSDEDGYMFEISAPSPCEAATH
jgi:ribosomal-protein-alanine N-acetyltransferase